MANKNNRKKIAEWLYERATNTSSRKLTRPKDNENILQPIDISTINTGKDFLTKRTFVRVRFVGSDVFYEFFLKDRDSYQTWNNKIDELDFDGDTMQDEPSNEVPEW